MSLTQNDLSQIQGAVREATKDLASKAEIQGLASKKDLEFAIGNMAQVVKRGFDATAAKTDVARLESKFELEIHEMKEKLIYIERDTAEIRKGLISRMELEDIWARLSLLEKKLGIVRGKT